MRLVLIPEQYQRNYLQRRLILEDLGITVSPRFDDGPATVEAAKELGLEGVSWNTLRHTFASRLAMQEPRRPDCCHLTSQRNDSGAAILPLEPVALPG